MTAFKRQLDALTEALDDAVIMIDLEGIVILWNGAAERLYGYTGAEMIGQSLGRIFLPERAHDLPDILGRVERGEGIRDLVAIRRHKLGHAVPISLTIHPLLDEHGRPAGAVGVVRDRRKPRFEPSAQRLSAIVESSQDAILSKDLDGRVTSWNLAAERMFGYTAAEMIGQSIRRLIPDDRQDEEDRILASIGRGERVSVFETVRRHKDGHLVPISVTVSPIFDDDGIVIGAANIARDITQQLALEAERSRLLAAAEENAAVTERLNQVGAVVAGALNRDEILQAVTDAATELTTAAFGAFFYNVTSDQGESYTLYSVSGVPRETFSTFPMPRTADAFPRTGRGAIPIRSDDIMTDPRYGHHTSYGLPQAHLPVRSYLAAPVKGRAGDVLGWLLFGHPQIARFTPHHERLAVGVAAWASIALENARLYIGVQEANRLKDEFLATLSHELRTPLNAILGYSRMITSGIVSPERQQKAVETIARNATSLTQIVEDVLDVSRIVSGKLRLHVQPVDVPRVVEAAVESVLPAAEARGVRIEMVIDPLVPPISGDPERLQQIVWNLMSNAVKFTNRGGAVKVSVQRVNAHVDITVSDTGVGIPRAFVPHIFERFRQADAGMTRERGGLGLGLSITRHLVEMHGGTIEARSDGEGRGATFRVKLPLMPARHDLRAGDLSPGPHALSLPDLRGVRILAVDDDPDALAMIRDILHSAGATVTTAGSSALALDELAQHTHDALLADLGMPQMDGFELIAAIRRHPDGAIRTLPAAALTAYARSEDRARALRRGFQIHLAKPIDPAELMAAIASLTHRTPIV